MSDFYKNEKIEEDEKRNIAFQTTNAIREAASLAQKKPQPITYERALDYIGDISPEIHKEIIQLLDKKNENDKVKYYKNEVQYQKILGKIVEPKDLIEKDIKKLQEKITAIEENKGFKLEMYKLIAAKDYFKPRKMSEHKLLEHDVFLAQHPFFGQEVHREGAYKDYKIANNHYLRLRYLHPDKAEHILGADLIYEQFDLATEKVRFVHLQYKVWDKKVLYLNDPRMKKQIDKMQKYLCAGGKCVGRHGKNYSTKFRMPYCAGFLRPTSNKIGSDSKLTTTGHHVPICELAKIRATDIKLTKDNIIGRSVSHSIFEESFTGNQLGSRWIKMDELDAFYQEAGLDFVTDTIRIHAQEVVVPTDEERQKKKQKTK